MFTKTVVKKECPTDNIGDPECYVGRFWRKRFYEADAKLKQAASKERQIEALYQQYNHTIQLPDKGAAGDKGAKILEKVDALLAELYRGVGKYQEQD